MESVAKRNSGAQRRRVALIKQRLRELGLPLSPGKPGRPKGSTARVEERLFRLQKDLAWIGRPDLSDLALARKLMKDPEYARAYKGISERALRRDIGTVQRKIWGSKKGWANILANRKR